MSSIINFFKKYNFHFILVLPYILFLIAAKNSESVVFITLLRPLFLGLLISILFFFIFKLLLKSNQKSALITTFSLFIFATYGNIYSLVNKLYYANLWPFAHIHRFLVGFIFIFLIILFLYFLKSKKKFETFNTFLNVFFTIFIIFNLTNFTFSNHYNKSTKQSTLKNNKNEIGQSQPNVYYFILDGYANDKILKKHFGIKKNKFSSFLKAKGFFVQDSVFSNYYGTNSSLGSTLNMDIEKFSEIGNNDVFKTFKENEYTINSIKSGFSVTENISNIDVLIEPSGLNELERILLKNTILRIDDIIGNSYYKRLLNQFKLIDNLITTKSNQFNFIHIVCPHPPFVFDANGHKILKINTEVNDWEPKKYYLNQLIYISKVMKDKVKKILKKDKNAIVIIQSDHGPFVSSINPEVTFEARSLIFNAIYAPKELQDKFKTTYSSVNTFVHLFNFLFKENRPLRKDEYTDKEKFMKSTLFKSKLFN